MILETTEEEEPRSLNSGIDSLELRTAIKLQFVHQAKYRHVVILTAATDMAQLAKRHHVLAVDLDGLDSFFKNV